MRSLKKMKDYIHKEHPKTVGKTEFWKQIKRTVNGKEVSEEDISMIVDQIIANLKFAPDDHLLDFGCGNGALASRLFSFIGKYTGVDFSEYLLEIAMEFFQPDDTVTYQLSDITSFLDGPFSTIQPNKVLIYGVMSYLTRTEVGNLFSKLAQKNSIKRVFIGNLPDSKLAKSFFQARSISDFDLDDAKSQIGVWWDKAEIYDLAHKVGFAPAIIQMPEAFYGAQYRFDLVLEKK